jgi:hypothetical protein
LAGVKLEYPAVSLMSHIKTTEILDGDTLLLLDHLVDFIQKSLHNFGYGTIVFVGPFNNPPDQLVSIYSISHGFLDPNSLD